MSEWKDGRRDYGDGWVGEVHDEGEWFSLLGLNDDECWLDGDEAACDALHAFLTRGRAQAGTVRVRIPVVTTTDGWCAYGWSGMGDDEAIGVATDSLDTSEPTRVSFVEANVPLPIVEPPPVVTGVVVSMDED